MSERSPHGPPAELSAPPIGNFAEVGAKIRALHVESERDCLAHGYMDLVALHRSAIAFIDEAIAAMKKNASVTH